LQAAKDTVVRAPWWAMILRPEKISEQDDVRQSDDKGGDGNDKNP
jgi:hypothetical protein